MTGLFLIFKSGLQSTVIGHGSCTSGRMAIGLNDHSDCKLQEVFHNFYLIMVRQKVKVTNEAGLHARPSSVLVKTASKFESEFYISMYGYKVNGKSILGVMTLAAESGAEMELIFDGPDEKEALKTITELFENQFQTN